MVVNDNPTQLAMLAEKLRKAGIEPRVRLPIPPRILIVDDDDELCNVLKKLFEVHGYEADTQGRRI